MSHLPPSPSSAQKAAEEECNNIVKWYKEGTFSLTAAVVLLDLALPLDEAKRFERSVALGQYIDLLQQRDVSTSGVSDRTLKVQSAPKPDNVDDANRKTEPSTESRAKATRGITVTDAKETPAAAPWSILSTLGKRKRVSASLEKTAEYLGHYNRHLAKAKAAILTRPGKPYLPESEWTRVLTGQALDLDLIYSCPFGTRKVATASDWYAAWNVAREATLLAFPHRSDELAEYTRSITNLFANCDQSSQSQRAIIAFDRTLRIKVAQCGDMELTDFHHPAYKTAERQHLDSIGKRMRDDDESQNGRRQSSKRAKTEVCHRFNRGKQHIGCSRRHVCVGCGGDKPAINCMPKCVAALAVL